jgi:carbonic anhydrase/acetyltransferase-like protein (isoleucine patch superfamily)
VSFNNQIITVRNFTPIVGEGTWMSPTATLVGDVKVGRRCSIWYNVLLRGDVEPIVIGDECNIQDGTIIHGTFHRAHATLGSRVSIGHGVILHGCSIGDESLIGMGSIIMDNAVVPRHSFVGAGSLITENAKFEEGWLIHGRPAKAIRKLTAEELKRLSDSADNYLKYKTWFEDAQA